MRGKTLIAYIAVAVLLIAGIVFGVVELFSDGKKGDDGSVKDIQTLISRNPVLRAVPSDAVAVLSFESFGEEMKVLGDRTKVFGALVGAVDDNKTAVFVESCAALAETDPKLKSSRALVSLHYSGGLVPVFSIESARCDTTVLSELSHIAQEAGMSSRSAEGFTVFSISDALALSAERHLKSGVSIASNEDFASCMFKSSSKNTIVFSNEAAGKILPAYLDRSLTRYSSFLKSYSSWTLMSIDEIKDERLRMGIHPSNIPVTRFYSQVFKDVKAGSMQFSKVVPSSTVWSVALSLQDRERLAENHLTFMDAQSRLAVATRERQTLAKSAGISPEDWAKLLNAMEIVRLAWRPEPEVDPVTAVMVRVGNGRSSHLPSSEDGIVDYAYAGFVSNLYGSLFHMDDESSCFFNDGWLAYGSRLAMENLRERILGGDSLAALLSDASASSIIPGHAVFAAYFSPSVCKMDATFATGMKKAVDATFDGAAYEPCVLSLDGSGMNLEVRRSAAFENMKTPALVSDAQLLVPTGPFEVSNADGGKNLIQQQSNNYISFKETSGKGIWSIPFSAPICGAVESIDYYGNGKIQYAFCAGDSFYLLDRTGRFVNGFPASTGKDILLGPKVFDLTGAHGYRAMVLHKDNTIGLYNLHGQISEGWKGISCEDSVISLPELLDVAGKKYWIVRTAREALLFGFNGGDAVKRETGSKSVRRDSEFEVVEKGVRVTCNDGKQRIIKLNDK